MQASCHRSSSLEKIYSVCRGEMKETPISSLQVSVKIPASCYIASKPSYEVFQLQ